MTTEDIQALRCPNCDKVRATPEQRGLCGEKCDHGNPIDGACPGCDALCWADRGWCREPAIDWRGRCLQAESALALLQTTLSPEVLQAIAEESAE